MESVPQSCALREQALILHVVGAVLKTVPTHILTAGRFWGAQTKMPPVLIL